MDTRRDQGWAHFMDGDNEAARVVYEDVLEHARLLGDPLLINRALVGVCQVLVAIGDADQAEPLAEELRDSGRNSQDYSSPSAGHHFLGDCAIIQGEYALARSHFRDALELNVHGESAAQQTWELLAFAFATAGLGRYEQALRLEGAIAGKWEELGMAFSVPFIEAWRTELIGAARAALGDEVANAAYATGRAMDWDEATALALAPD